MDSSFDGGEIDMGRNFRIPMLIVLAVLIFILVVFIMGKHYFRLFGT